MISATIYGRLGRDPETKTTNNGTNLVILSVGSNDFSSKDEKSTTWVKCILWGKIGESISNRFKKGDEVAVIGELKEVRYVNSEGAEKRYIECNSNRAFYSCNKTKVENNQNQSNQSNYSQQNNAVAPNQNYSKPPTPTGSTYDKSNPIEDIPF